MYDCALGGYHNFAVDREFLAQAEAAVPDVRAIAQANRAFLGRAVRWLVGAGVRQFLDIGSGIPTLGNVHQVAQQAAPDARVVYVDIDPVAVEHSAAILADNPLATVVEADLRRPSEILYRPDVVELLDFSRPVAVLLVAVLHFISDDDGPERIVAALHEPLVSGSYLVVSHVAPDPSPQRRAAQDVARKLYERTPTPVYLRDSGQVRRLLGDLEIVDPGVVTAPEWHPDPDAPRRSAMPSALVAVGRKN